jgi:hypothetical protein
MSSKVPIKGAHCLRQEETAKIFIIKEEFMVFLGALLCLCGLGVFAMSITMAILDSFEDTFEEEEEKEDERRKED